MKRRNHNPVFDKQVADVALTRGLSRASVFCALLVASGRADTSKIAPAWYEKCFEQLAIVPKDVAKSSAFDNLCECRNTKNEDERELHKKGCLYVTWRALIGDPLESMLGEMKNETRK